MCPPHFALYHRHRSDDYGTAGESGTLAISLLGESGQEPLS